MHSFTPLAAFLLIAPALAAPIDQASSSSALLARGFAQDMGVAWDLAVAHFRPPKALKNALFRAGEVLQVEGAQQIEKMSQGDLATLVKYAKMGQPEAVAAMNKLVPETGFPEDVWARLSPGDQALINEWNSARLAVVPNTAGNQVSQAFKAKWNSMSRPARAALIVAVATGSTVAGVVVAGAVIRAALGLSADEPLPTNGLSEEQLAKMEVWGQEHPDQYAALVKDAMAVPGVTQDQLQELYDHAPDGFLAQAEAASAQMDGTASVATTDNVDGTADATSDNAVTPTAIPASTESTPAKRSLADLD